MVPFSTVLLEKYFQRIEISSSPLRKSLLEKVILKKIWGTKFQVGEVTTGRANTLAGEGGEGGPNLQVPPVPSTKGNPECSPSNMSCSRLGAMPTV